MMRTPAGTICWLVALMACAGSVMAAPDPSAVIARVDGHGITLGEWSYFVAPTFQQRMRMIHQLHPQGKGPAYEQEVERLMEDRRRDGRETLIKMHLMLALNPERSAALMRDVDPVPPTPITPELLGAIGMSREQVLTFCREMQAANRILAEQFPEPPGVTEEEVEAHYERDPDQFRDRSRDRFLFQSITLKVGDDDPEGGPQLKQAKELLERIRKGVSFSELSREHSVDHAAGASRDEFRCDLNPAVAAALEKAGDAEVVGPVVFGGAVIILKRESMRTGPVQPLDGRVKALIRSLLEYEKSQARIDAWLAPHMEGRDIERLPWPKEEAPGGNDVPGEKDGPGGNDEPPVADPVPGRPGFCFNPFTGNLVDARGIPAGRLVLDPADPNPEHRFRVPRVPE